MKRASSEIIIFDDIIIKYDIMTRTQIIKILSLSDADDNSEVAFYVYKKK